MHVPVKGDISESALFAPINGILTGIVPCLVGTPTHRNLEPTHTLNYFHRVESLQGHIPEND